MNELLYAIKLRVSIVYIRYLVMTNTDSMFKEMKQQLKPRGKQGLVN